MLPQTELAAYQSGINLPLLNDIIAFVRDTSKAGRDARNGLRKSCIFLDDSVTGTAMQEKYGFLYLGELLERYEERFGMTGQDFRAIALALGYTHGMTDDSMFIGPQRHDFLRKLKAKAPGDVYLTGALYLLEKDADPAHGQALLERDYTATEEAIFAFSLLRDRDDAFMRFRPVLFRLLGQERTIPVPGNTRVLDWLVSWLAPIIKPLRGKDTALFRALSAMPVSFVRPGSRHHDVLLDAKWTALEISYFNMMSVLARTRADTIRSESLVAEKIAIQLLREVFASESALPPPVYDELSMVLELYSRFQIRYEGSESLVEALETGCRIRNPETFIWFLGHAQPNHPAFRSFDILDGKWDGLARAVKPGKYLTLFEYGLTHDLDAAGIRERIARYDQITGGNYLAAFQENERLGRFDLLVNRGILDLWQCFRDNLDGAGSPDSLCLVDYIKHYVRELPTIQAYRFYEDFFAAYPVRYLERYFHYDYRYFFHALVDTGSSYHYEFRLRPWKDFLDDGQKLRLLDWLEEYMFTFDPKRYMQFAAALLLDEDVAGLFPMDEQLDLFRMVLPELSEGTANVLKRRYMSQEELQAEKEAQEAARKEAARRQALAEEEGIRNKFEQIPKGSFSTVVDFLRAYRYWKPSSRIACRTVYENLDRLLASKSYRLRREDAAMFLRTCARLAEDGSMPLSEIQTYVASIKEVEDSNDDENE